MEFSYTVVSDVCEGIADCISVCPVECIHWAKGRTNAKGTRFVYIDAAACIDCGACLSVCPIEGAILDEWKPELQQVGLASQYRSLRPEWRTTLVRDLAQRLLLQPEPGLLAVLADALEEAGCDDTRLLTYCRQDVSRSRGKRVAELICAAPGALD